jgi:hypothetical protein
LEFHTNILDLDLVCGVRAEPRSPAAVSICQPETSWVSAVLHALNGARLQGGS